MGGEMVMLARAVPELPEGEGWAYEAKLDGWRAVITVDVGKVRVSSRRGRPLGTYFPEIVEAAAGLPAGTVLDGELIVPVDGGADFAALQRRIHPSERRAAELSRTATAGLVVFDLLGLPGRDLRGESYELRRAALCDLFAGMPGPIGVMPMTTDRAAAARAWMSGRPAGLEGVVAKRRDERYKPGKRAWSKTRARARSLGVVGAVIGRIDRPRVLLLGQSDQRGWLRFVASTGVLPKPVRREVGQLLSPPNRVHPWPVSLAASRLGMLPGEERVAITPVEPELVVEFDHDFAYEHHRYRHAVKLTGLRPDRPIDPLD